MYSEDEDFIILNKLIDYKLTSEEFNEKVNKHIEESHKA